MIQWVQEFIRHSPFVVMSTSSSAGQCDASPKGGLPGFVKVLSDTQLLIPDVAGNKLFQSFENLETNANIGLLFFIPGINATARVNGSVKVLDHTHPDFEKLTLEVYEQDEKAKILQAMMVTVTESYSQCPRALAFSQLWNTRVIKDNIETPPVEKWMAGY